MKSSIQKKICVLVVYYGKFPPSIVMWADSAKYQKGIDFLFITDQKQPSYLKDFKWINISFSDLVDQIIDTLEIDVQIKSPYKLCDFRPAYGLIFNNYLSGYDYWGYCDLDLIWGDLNLTLNTGLNTSPDLLYSRGHLSLYRNCEEINSLFKTKLLVNKGITDYQEVFMQPENCCFDETYGIFKIFRLKNKTVYHNQNFIDIKANSIKFLPSNIKKHPIQFFIYHKGNIYNFYKKNWWFFSVEYEKSEYSYIHFQKRKINFMEFKKTNSFYLIRSKSIIEFNSLNEIINSKKVLFDINFGHFINRIKERFLTKLKFKNTVFNNYLNTGNDY